MYPFIDLGFFKLPTYGISLACGFLIAIYISQVRYKKAGGELKDFIQSLAVWIIVSGLIGARLLYIIVEFDDFVKHPLNYIFAREGFVFYGGLIGGLCGGAWIIKKSNQNFFTIADILAPSIPVAQALGRVGCFLNGCCYGEECHLPIAIVLPAVDNIPRFPVQIIESLACIAISLILWTLDKYKRFIGTTFLFYLILYSALRFLLEFLRDDFRGSLFGLISTSQFISMILFFGAFILLYLKWHTKPRT